MRTYIRLELKKLGLKRCITGAIIILFFMLMFLTIGIWSGSAPGQVKDSYDAYMPRMINLLVVFSMICYSSVFTSQLVIGEYTRKTILILFSYPLDRKKIICIKIGIISIFTSVCIFIMNVVCHVYLIVINQFFHLVTGSPDAAYLTLCLKQTLFGSLMGGILSLIPFAVGMFRKSMPATFISSIVVSGIFMETVGISPGGQVVLLFSAGLIILTVWLVFYILRHRIEELDSV